MPFCPKCRYEYRPEIKVCPDCGLKLKAKLQDEAEPEPIGEGLVRVASYLLESDAQAAKLNLERNGVRVALTNETISSANPAIAFADGGIHVLVLESEADRARNILSG